MITTQLIKAALDEDIGNGDVTTRLTVPVRHRSVGRIVAREPGVLAGVDVCHRVFQAVSPHVRFIRKKRDGSVLKRGDLIATVSGPTRHILTAERTALNFVQRLSGIATLTRRFVDAIRGTGTVILDTRKTTPGWRALEKAAVRCGNGSNHRQGLFDMVLIKDNHIAAAGSVTAALDACREARVQVEVEVKTIAGLREALSAGANRILLDNMSPAQLSRAVKLTAGKAQLEASGGVNLKRVRRIAATGVDFISVGALTHSAPALDIALDL